MIVLFIFVDIVYTRERNGRGNPTGLTLSLSSFLLLPPICPLLCPTHPNLCGWFLRGWRFSQRTCLPCVKEVGFNPNTKPKPNSQNHRRKLFPTVEQTQGCVLGRYSNLPGPIFLSDYQCDMTHTCIISIAQFWLKYT